MSELSSRLKQLLNDAKISEAELARRTGIAQPMVNRLATGKNKNPKLETLKPIAKYFSVTFSQLLGEEALPSNGGLTASQANPLFQLPLMQWNDVNTETFISNQSVSTTAKVSDKAFALLIDNSDYLPRFNANTLLIIDSNVEPQHNDFVLVCNTQNNTYQLMQLKTNSQSNNKKELISLKAGDNQNKPVAYDEEVHKITGVLIQAVYDYN